MFAKIPAVYWKVSCVLFTSIMAPLGIKHLDHFDRVTPAETCPAGTSNVLFQDLTPVTARIFARGTGPTPAAAFQTAVDAALHQAVVAEVSPAEWRRRGPEYLAAVRRDGTGVLRTWHEVSSGAEARPAGIVFHSEVAVEVDVAALRECLTAVRPATPN